MRDETEDVFGEFLVPISQSSPKVSFTHLINKASQLHLFIERKCYLSNWSNLVRILLNQELPLWLLQFSICCVSNFSWSLETYSWKGSPGIRSIPEIVKSRIKRFFNLELQNRGNPIKFFFSGYRIGFRLWKTRRLVLWQRIAQKVDHRTSLAYESSGACGLAEPWQRCSRAVYDWWVGAYADSWCSNSPGSPAGLAQKGETNIHGLWLLIGFLSWSKYWNDMQLTL